MPGQPACLVIDSADALGDVPGGSLSVPSLEKAGRSAGAPAMARFLVSPHPAAIVISALLLRLAEQFQLKRCVAQVYFPASEMGPRAIEELQKQTVSLLSFQKIPQKVFGAQLAFNMLSRLPGKHGSEFCAVETRIRRQLREYLGDRVPAPALRFFQVAVFYSLAFSIFVELGQAATAEAVTAALAGEHITVRRRSEAAPSQVEAAGSGEILLDAVTIDADHPAVCWVWAAVDNIRLAAENAVDIAESCLHWHHPKQ
jgi:aspartate-semialdehyde dehydrogenase